MESTTIRRYIRHNIAALRLVGLWTDAEGIFASKYYWMYYLFVTICCTGLFNLTQLVYLISGFGDIEKVATSGYLFLICIMANLKAVFFWRKFPLFKSILDRLDEDEFQPRNEEQRLETFRNMSVHIGAQIFFTLVFVMLMVLWTVVPFLLFANPKLPFKAWYPFDMETHFALCYVHQAIGMLFVASTNMLVDLATVGMIAYVGAECDILSNCLRNLYGFTKKAVEEGDDKPNDLHSRTLEEMNTTLLGYIRYHWRILEFAEDVNEIFTTYVFILFATSLLAICLTMFDLTIEENTVVDNITFIVYQAGILFELLIYCFFGNELIVKSDRIAFALYECSWVECPLVFKKNMIFFILRTNLRPIKMMGMNFFVLSLPSFSSILRASWSFFAMLHQMQLKNERDG